MAKKMTRRAVYEAIHECIRYRIADIGHQRHEAEKRHLAPDCYDADAAYFQAVKGEVDKLFSDLKPARI